MIEYLTPIVQVAQVAFYLVGGTVAVVTYRSAKKGLLNTVNTEYHKRVIDRLRELADELLSEFDRKSPNHWASHEPVLEAVAAINKQYKSTIDKPGGPFLSGIPVSSVDMRLSDFVRKIKHDPFVPREIRQTLLDALQRRMEITREVTWNHLTAYQRDLREGRYTETLDDNGDWVHNEITDELYEKGYGISQIEDEVDRILDSIQAYFAMFDPLPKKRVDASWFPRLTIGAPRKEVRSIAPDAG